VNKALTALLAVLLFSMPILAQEPISDAELLERLDEARFPDRSVTSIRVRITSETPEGTREAEVIVYFAEFDGASYARIDFLAPEELAGQTYLTVPDAAYFYAPDLDFPIKTSAAGELFGDAAVAQTSGIRFLSEYTIAARRTVQATDGVELLELDLVAVDYTVAFQAITVRVDPITLRPVSATLFAVSGLPFYDVTYSNYVTRENGDVYVSVQEIANRLFLGRVTTSGILEATAAELPAALFDPEALGSSG